MFSDGAVWVRPLFGKRRRVLFIRFAHSRRLYWRGGGGGRPSAEQKTFVRWERSVESCARWSANDYNPKISSGPGASTFGRTKSVFRTGSGLRDPAASSIRPEAFTLFFVCSPPQPSTGPGLRNRIYTTKIRARIYSLLYTKRPSFIFMWV